MKVCHLLIWLLLALLLLAKAGAAVVVTYRGDQPNLFPLLPNPVSSALDINGDGIDDFEFHRNGGLVSSMTAHGDNRFISTPAIAPDLGGYITPVETGSIIGSDTTLLSGNWHHHSDNGGGSGFGLGTMYLIDAYIAVEFQLADGIHYGWIHYVGFGVPQFPFYDEDGNLIGLIDGLGTVGGTIDAWAWETEPGQPIVAKAIPEPTSALLLVFGVLRIACHRKR